MNLLRPLALGLLLPACNLVIDADEHDERLDADGDGFVSTLHGGDDCDDDAADVNPGQPEVCNDIDDNCTGNIDDDPIDGDTWMLDADNDGYGRPEETVEACDPPDGYIPLKPDDPDCNDGDAAINPGAEETCDGEDNDCSGTADDGLTGTWYQDSDEDGYGDEDQSSEGCPPGDGVWVENSDDCDDGDDAIRPDAAEVCGDDVDDDCSGDADACASLPLADADVIGPGGLWGDQFGWVLSAHDDKVLTSAPGVDLAVGTAWFFAEPWDVELDGARAGLTILGTDSADDFGAASAIGPDIQGEGYLSLAVGAPGYGSEGAVAVFVALPGSDLDFDDADSYLLGDTENDRLGAMVLIAEDVTGDAVADLIVGDPGFNTDDYRGAAWVFAGPVSGILSIDDGERLEGEEANSRAGEILAAGDLDGDGTGDVIVSATQTGTLQGTVYIVTGPIGGNLELSDANHVIAAGDVYELFGAPMATGDLDGDGTDDLAVGAIGVNRTSFDSGELGYTYIFTTAATESLSSATQATARLEQQLRYDSADPEEQGLGLDASGDVDGDGRNELLIGYPAANADGAGDGSSYLVYGGMEGTTSLDQAQVRFTAQGPAEAAGKSTVLADMDGDDLADILIGAPGADKGTGVVYGVLATGL